MTFANMNLVELSQRLKQLRVGRGLSLEEVARAAGQTRSWLSKVENFRITPSLAALGRVADALGTTTSKLLDGLDVRPKIHITRVNQRRLVERDAQNSNIVYHQLTTGRLGRLMNPFLLDVPAGGGRTVPRPHEGEEFLIVIKGQVVLEYDGEDQKLATGDTAYFDAETPHRLHNPSSKDAQVLCVFHEKA
jgi:transcriptional regulator with XRE-family HTH domain